MSTEHDRVARIVNATEEELAELQRVAASMAPSLPDFLLARIAEDEERATFVRNQIDGRFPEIEPWRLSWQDEYDLLCIEPSRVLAECDAKRRIVAWHRLIDGLDTEDIPVRGCCNCIASGAEPPYIIAGPCMTVRLLALPYADHPDYREEWRP